MDNVRHRFLPRWPFLRQNHPMLVLLRIFCLIRPCRTALEVSCPQKQIENIFKNALLSKNAAEKVIFFCILAPKWPHGQKIDVGHYQCLSFILIHVHAIQHEFCQAFIWNWPFCSMPPIPLNCIASIYICIYVNVYILGLE